MEVRKGPVDQFFELHEPQMVEQLVEVPKIVVGLAVSCIEAGSSWPGERHCRRSRAVPRPNPNSKGLLVKLGLLGPEQATQLALMKQQLQKLLVKLGLPSLRRTVLR